MYGPYAPNKSLNTHIYMGTLQVLIPLFGCFSCIILSEYTILSMLQGIILYQVSLTTILANLPSYRREEASILS